LPSRQPLPLLPSPSGQSLPLLPSLCTWPRAEQTPDWACCESMRGSTGIDACPRNVHATSNSGLHVPAGSTWHGMPWAGRRLSRCSTLSSCPLHHQHLQVCRAQTWHPACRWELTGMHGGPHAQGQLLGWGAGRVSISDWALHIPFSCGARRLNKAEG
jgi:hypothetical protein